MQCNKYCVMKLEFYLIYLKKNKQTTSIEFDNNCLSVQFLWDVKFIKLSETVFDHSSPFSSLVDQMCNLLYINTDNKTDYRICEEEYGWRSKPIDRTSLHTGPQLYGRNVALECKKKLRWRRLRMTTKLLLSTILFCKDWKPCTFEILDVYNKTR